MAPSSFLLDAATQHLSFADRIHHPGLIVLSVLVSVFCAAMAVQTAQIAQLMQNRLYRQMAIGSGALALAGGIWAMHLIAMLAFSLPSEFGHHVGLTLLSLVPACVASWLALRILSLGTIPLWRLVSSGALVGVGIGAMHTIGILALQTPLGIRHAPDAFPWSLAADVLLAIAALAGHHALQKTRLSPLARVIASGAMLGVAIAATHYTGMAGLRFSGVSAAPAGGGLVLNAVYASLILSSFAITVSVMVVALNGLIRSRELYRQLDEGSSRLRATLDTAVDGIITIDGRGLIQEFNHSAERLFGWKAEEVMGRNISMLMPEPFQSAHDGYLRNYLESGKAKIIGIGREVVGLRKDGSHMPMRLAVGRVELPGELLFVGFVTDISDRHALEQSLRETAERAKQAAAAKSTFVANISHEIRTPMNSIIGFTELLLQTELTAVQRSHLKTVRQASRSLLRLINDILDTTKMEKGRLELEAADFSLKSVALQVESSLRLAAQAKQLALATYYPPEMPEHFRGDALRVQQILTNLVGNAIKFTESGSVDVVFAYGGGTVHVQVRDTGIGMTSAQVKAIFAPFIQADASISRRFGGTGLGTTIARQLVELMGGEIEVESLPGYGSTFHVRLPLAAGVRPQPRDVAGVAVSLPSLRILIADDVPQNLELLRLILEREGHVVIQAGDGGDAAERFIAGQFDVVLMDVQMPGCDGLEATRRIRRFERENARARTPIIALTASVMLEDRRAAREAGMDGFAWKPLEAPRLFAEIARVLGHEAPPTGGGASDDEMSVMAREGVDWERGIALWGGREKLLGALSQFLGSAQRRYPLVDAEGEAVGTQQLLSSVHGLRGAAGNLALPAVARLAAKIEDLLRSGQREVALSRIPELGERLALAHRAIATQAAGHDDGDDAAPPREPPGDAGQPVDVAAALVELLEILSRNELDDHALNLACSRLESAGRRPDAHALRVAVDAFEFREASGLLERLIADYGCTASL